MLEIVRYELFCLNPHCLRYSEGQEEQKCPYCGSDRVAIVNDFAVRGKTNVFTSSQSDKYAHGDEGEILECEHCFEKSPRTPDNRCCWCGWKHSQKKAKLHKFATDLKKESSNV